ncbi:MAG: hypothetical protein ACLFVC_09365 [Opitutales bacterium]
MTWIRSAPLILPGILVALLLSACGPDARPRDPGLRALARDFRAANEAATIEPMLKLYELDGADERTVSLLKLTLQYEHGLEIDSIEFEPLSGAPEETIRFVHDGVHYGPSLEPRYRMRVRYAADDGFTSLFTIGQREDGAWRIVSAKPLPEPEL